MIRGFRTSIMNLRVGEIQLITMVSAYCVTFVFGGKMSYEEKVSTIRTTKYSKSSLVLLLGCVTSREMVYNETNVTTG